MIRSSSTDKDAPKTLAIRCLGRRTEIVVRTEGNWRASSASDIQVAHQLNDQPLVKLTWTASADGNTANYKKDSVGFLRSLPEGTRLKISVLDASGRGHEATFELAGLDAVRGRIAASCKWPPIVTRTNMSSEQR